MFYSQCLLSKKGPLAAIWVAGCCFKRLKKRQVAETHIPSSVDKILLEGLDSVTYRILAYLLLGLVRIYSRKVEYLFQDCHGTVSDINRFSVGKKVIPFRDLVRSSNSILLPERYELDAFQLEVADAACSGYTARSEDIILQDDREDVPGPWSSDKNLFDNEVSPHLKENYNAQTSPGISRQQQACSSLETPDKAAADREISTNAYTPPDIVLSSHQMDKDMEFRCPDQVKTFQTGKEKLRELKFTQEESMDIDMICGSDVELLNLINEYQERKPDDGGMDNLEKVTLEEHDHVTLKDKEMPSIVEKTPNSEVPDTAELLAVRTPPKESIQRPLKRKCIIDETLVLDNKEMKQAINDASDLVCKRRKAPHTVVDIWRFSHIPTLATRNFLEPLIPCAALEMQHVFYSETTEKTKTSLCLTADPVQTVEAVGKLHDVGSPRSLADGRLAIAPGTPVRCPASARLFASPRAADSDGENLENLYENARKEPSVHEDEEGHGPILMDEMDANEGHNQEPQKNKNGMSARTRTVARHLHQVMHRKKQQGQESVSLLPILARRTKAENARLFFEVLVLATGGFVKVKQEKPYDDVVLQETPEIEEALDNCS